MSGAEFNELLKRPTLTPADARAIERQAESIAQVNITIGEGGGPGSTRSTPVLRGRTHEADHESPAPRTTTRDVFHITIEEGRFFTEGEVSHRRRVVVLGQTPYLALFPNVDPIGKTVRIGNQPYTVIGVMGPRPGIGQDSTPVRTTSR